MRLRDIPQAWDDYRADRVLRARQEAHDRDARCELRQAWHEACERPNLGLSHAVATSVGVFPARAPRIEEIALGTADEPTRFTVRMPYGLLVEDLEDAGQELAAALFCHRLRFDPVGAGLVAVTLIEHDPHAAIVEHVVRVPGALSLGPDEFGEVMAFPLRSLPHTAIQGTTGGGKSTGIYWWLQQFAEMGPAEVRVAGVDPSGLLFRPMASDRWRVSGLRDAHRAVDVLEDLVREMDNRCEAMPPDEDRLPCGADTDHPYLAVLLEELPGLLVALDAVDSKLAKRARAAVSRLAAEGRKVGIRLVMIAQRFDATSTAGATVRNNCGLRISYAVENRSAVEFLHEGISPDLADQHTRALPGVSLVTAPGRDPVRVRWPVTSYQEWAATARRHSPPPLSAAA